MESSPAEAGNRNKARLGTALWLVLILLLLVVPMFTYQDPPPGQEGILVNLGLPDQGQGNENAGPSEPEVDQPEELEEEQPEESEDRPEEPIDEPEPEDAPPVQEEVVTSEDPEAVALEKEKEEERKRQEAAEAKRKAEEEARKKKEEEADKLKDQLGGMFGEGDGKGETGKPGNQGDPEGDPNSDVLEGISTGSGKVGGGLGSRGIRDTPKITDKSQKTGTVVLNVCVDRAGNVISADFTQKGSTTSNAELVKMARDNAREWKFAAGNVDKQCGTITYVFKTQ